MKTTNLSRVLLCCLVGVLTVTALSAYVLLSPRRTWDSAPHIIVDSRGQSSVTDGDGGATRTVNAITSSQAWNGAGAGTVVTAVKGSVASWQLGDGIPMLNFRDPERVCNGNCLAATFTGFYEPRGDGTYRIFDADVVTSGSKRIAWTSAGEPDGCSGEYYIEGVMVHEVGHVLGIGHTDVTGATMYPSVSACNNGPATTEADDEAALNDLY
ncbi:MAG TPA: matrixin family metalloprotease [Thermoanaerobaculia bacterium]|nr:matrixin family metalloprotease [Thermoanaerobaculia bacterium]